MPAATRYHDVVKKKLKSRRPLAGRSLGRRAESVRRHRAGHGEAARRCGGPRLAGRHTNLVSREFGSQAVPRLDLLGRRSAIGPAGERPWRLLARLPRHLSDRGLPGALPASMPGAASPTRRSSTRASSRPSSVRHDRQPHLWLRRLPGRLPLEQVRQRALASRPCPRGRRLKAPRARRSRPARRRRVPRPVPQEPDQARRATTASCATC